MWSQWMLALGLMLVLEGLLPFATPAAWRAAFRKITDLSDGQIRFVALVAIIGGLALVVAFRPES
jgi:uncharacterized protein